MITKQKFRAYNNIQMSNMVNMSNYSAVATMSGLTINEVADITENYYKYAKKFISKKVK